MFVCLLVGSSMELSRQDTLPGPTLAFGTRSPRLLLLLGHNHRPLGCPFSRSALLSLVFPLSLGTCVVTSSSHSRLPLVLHYFPCGSLWPFFLSSTVSFVLFTVISDSEFELISSPSSSGLFYTRYAPWWSRSRSSFGSLLQPYLFVTVSPATSPHLVITFFFSSNLMSCLWAFPERLEINI